MKQIIFFIKANGIFILILAIYSCQPSDLEKRLIINENESIQLSHPKVVLDKLVNPASPLIVNGALIFSESGTGTINKIEKGKVVPLITGFKKDNYGGYDISAQGITVEPRSGLWVVCAAEAEGKVYIYDPKNFPIDAEKGRPIELVGAIDDNPWESVIIGDIIVASGGTAKQYQGIFDEINPFPLSPVFSVATGLIGMAKHPTRSEVFGAVFGIPPNGGSIIKWTPSISDTQDSTSVEIATIATGLRNIVDVAFTKQGTLFALEFGDFNAEGSGRLLVVNEKNGEFISILEGLNSPSSMTFDEKKQLIYISEFSVPANEKNGKLIQLQYQEFQ